MHQIEWFDKFETLIDNIKNLGLSLKYGKDSKPFCINPSGFMFCFFTFYFGKLIKCIHVSQNLKFANLQV